MYEKLKQLYPNADFVTDIILQDDGAGVYIKHFDSAKLGAQPTQAAIDAVVIAPPKIKAVTMRQARLALLGAGMLSTVNTMLAGMTGAQGEAARIEWEYSQEVQRDRGLVQSLGTQLGA
jgi:hypothetical protein